MRRKAFTLTEVLVVIAIIGTLCALILPAVMAARNAANPIPTVNQPVFNSIQLPPGAEIVQQLDEHWVIFDLSVPKIGSSEKETQRFLLFSGDRLGQEVLTVLRN